MANSTKFIRDMIEIKPTRDDKGLQTSLTITLYDNRMFSVNGKAFSSSAVSGTLSIGRQLLQVLELMEYEFTKRRNTLAEAPKRRKKK